MINSEVIDGKTYFNAEARGVNYMAYVDYAGRWNVYSHRRALGRHVPGVRFFDTAAEVENNVKAMRGLALAVQMKGN